MVGAVQFLQKKLKMGQRAIEYLPEPSVDYPLVARPEGGHRSRVAIGDAVFGDGRFIVVAGPCAVESAEQIDRAARAVSALGAAVLRGGAYKPRTSPYSFRGLGRDGVELMAEACRRRGIPCVTEVMDPRLIDEMAPLVDAFQVGARNMHNYDLLEALGHTDRPVLLKRGFGATLREWLLAAEYVARGGNDQIVLCERGIRAFGDETRFTLDVAGALWAQQRSRLPVIVDPSHATGQPELIGPLCAAAVACGLDGVMVEVHPEPAESRSDADQALDPAQFEAVMARITTILSVTERTL